MNNAAHKIHHVSRPARHYNGKSVLKKIYAKPINDIKVRSKALRRYAQRYAARKPLKTLGMVSAVSIFSGFLIGYIAGRK